MTSTRITLMADLEITLDVADDDRSAACLGSDPEIRINEAA
jgi:hypothetical protein